MRNLIVFIAAFILTQSVSMANTNPEVHKEIQRKVIVDLSQIELDEHKNEFVSVKFKIEDQKIKIISILGTKKELTEIMIKELQEMVVKSDSEEATTFHYKFNFEKE